MIAPFFFALTFLALLGSGLMAGLFFAFSTSVMAALARLPAGVREARFVWVAGRPEVVLSDAALRRTVLDGRTGAEVRLDQAALFDNARKLLPGAAQVAGA